MALQAQVDTLTSRGGLNNEGADPPYRSQQSQSEKDKKRDAFRKQLKALKPPGDGDAKTVKVGDKTYHWCEGNGAHKPKWVAHLPSKCSGITGQLPQHMAPKRDKVDGGPLASAAVVNFDSDEEDR